LEMAAAAGTEWERVKAGGGGPGARSSHGVAASGDGSAAWVIGGEARAREPAGMVVWRLDFGKGAVAGAASANWKRCSTPGDDGMPPARNAHAQALIGTDLWVFGGRTSVEMGEGALDDIWRFDTVAEVWHGPVASGGAPAPRSYHAGCAAGGRFYIFGGCGEAGRLNDFHCFDPEKAAWRELPTPPGVDGRGGPTLEAFWGGRTLLLFAGFAGRETRDVLTFDIESEKWTRRADLSSDLAPRSVCASFPTPDGRIVVYGGEVEPSERGHEGAGGFSGDVLEFDADGAARRLVPAPLTSDRPTPRGWTAMAPLPLTACNLQARRAHKDACAECNEHLHACKEHACRVHAVLFGGLAGDDASPERLSDAWVLHLE